MDYGFRRALPYIIAAMESQGLDMGELRWNSPGFGVWNFDCAQE